jgi:hypothetical protein
MAKQDRDTVRSLTFLVNKMDPECVFVAIHGDGSGELRDVVQFCFSLSPIILLLPMLYEPFNVFDLCAISCLIGKGRLPGNVAYLNLF